MCEQVVFHAQMAGEAKWFYLQDVVDEVTEKLIRRHPHVFGSVKADDSVQFLKTGMLSSWKKKRNAPMP